MSTTTASPNQMSWIADLSRRDWWEALPLLQAAYDASEYGQQRPLELTKSSGIKWLGVAIDHDAASELIDALKCL